MLTDYTTMQKGEIAAATGTALQAAEAIIEKVVAESADRTLANTLLELERAGRILSDAYGPGPFMGKVHPNADIRTEATEWEEKVSKWTNELIFRTDLAAAVKGFAATDEANSLAGVERRLLDEWLRDLRRAGHDLDAAARDSLKALQERLIELQVAYERNLAEVDDGIDMTRDELAGLPDEYVDRLRKNDDGTFRVSMAYPDYMPFIEQGKNRDLRKALQFKFWNRAAEANTALLAEAVDIRSRIAAIFGHASWADHMLEVKMAKNLQAVNGFYDSVIPGLTAKASDERDALQALLSAEHEGELQPWDWFYYANERRKTNYGIDPNEVAKYFPLDRVIAGMFEITGEVFGLEYSRVEDPHAWHEDVAVYEIRNSGDAEPLAYFYADLFPREGKFGHAAAFPIEYGVRETDGSYRKPIAAIVANFTKPTDTQPSLLEHGEALTLFHEFGHVLHFCLTTVDMLRFSGYDTEWDFVEAPSQIMEHWMWQPEVLQRFAAHHETGDVIPEDLVNRLVEARDLHVGMHTIRQVFLGKLDMMLHDGSDITDLEAVSREANKLTLLPFHEGTHFLASFGHLMGGYDAGYYGYLWSKVYGDDMFSEFQRLGVTSPEVGKRYRDEVLAVGGSRDAIDHLRAFLQRDPNSDAFLKNLGLGSK
jgi:oligopeptidase A